LQWVLIQQTEAALEPEVGANARRVEGDDKPPRHASDREVASGPPGVIVERLCASSHGTTLEHNRPQDATVGVITLSVCDLLGVLYARTSRNAVRTKFAEAAFRAPGRIGDPEGFVVSGSIYRGEAEAEDVAEAEAEDVAAVVSRAVFSGG
jgi:hypothetical protein